ncbi:ATP-binding protein [Streptomyces sp. TRM68367]|uniref:ATP-binding protein n=1 Tax=Streptomyces sp. TRM68367 TaxID=2758415 RepID=UPI00165C529D|nr:ATP-binding protein [Streptomyces sp. TRM68367]MBC9729918.1 ATP-binding protein [Streptomyces sp. TRM68367]
MPGATERYAPHPYTGGRTAVLRALASWRTEWPGTPRVLVLTGNPGSGRSHLITGFLMLCDPEYRKRLPVDDLDPSTVPPELPAPAVPGAAGMTAAQVVRLLADHFGLEADDVADVFIELATLARPVTVVVPDVDRAGPVRTAGEPARLTREVLKPLAALESVHLLTEMPRRLAEEFAGGLPAGTVQVIDLDEPQWADPDGLVLQAEALLNPRLGAPDMPFTTDPAARQSLAEAVGGQAGNSPLVVELAVQSILTSPGTVAPHDEAFLPSSIGQALDLHARRLGADPQTLRQLLAPLALAEGDGLPVDIWARLVNALAGKDMSGVIAGSGALTGPFVKSLQPDEAGSTHTLLQLLHPAIGDEIRAGLPSVRAAQTQIAMALLEAVPEQDWGKADPYVRNHIAGHTLEAGLLPQLLTDPALFVHADPVPLRAAIEAVPTEELGAPARTYLRTAPLLTRTQAPTVLRAALLETAFVEDGLPEYADATHRLGLELPWRTLWSLPVPGISGVTVGSLPRPAGPAISVAVLVVPAGTPGAHPVGETVEENETGRSAVLIHALVRPDDLGETDTAPGPTQILRPSEEERAAAPLGLSRGADYIRVWDRTSQEIVAALISDMPFTAADLSPDGVLLVATERGSKALRIRPRPAPAPTAPPVSH